MIHTAHDFTANMGGVVVSTRLRTVQHKTLHRCVRLSIQCCDVTQKHQKQQKKHQQGACEVTSHGTTWTLHNDAR